jgi:hypothetical protein
VLAGRDYTQALLEPTPSFLSVGSKMKDLLTPGGNAPNRIVPRLRRQAKVSFSKDPGYTAVRLNPFRAIFPHMRVAFSHFANRGSVDDVYA